MANISALVPYKHNVFFSIISLASVDSDYKFVWVGSYIASRTARMWT